MKLLFFIFCVKCTIILFSFRQTYSEELSNLHVFIFHASHSINHALLRLTEAIRNSLDDKIFLCSIIVYLQKAFDTINHDINLSSVGLEGFSLTGSNHTFLIGSNML